MAAIQAASRPGYDVTRHAVSLLSTGDLGWIQLGNFLVTGTLAIAGAIGLRRALRGQPGGRWVPILLGLSGAGIVSAGIFRTDPANGFPPGTPLDAPAVSTLHGMLHQLSGSVASRS